MLMIRYHCNQIINQKNKIMESKNQNSIFKTTTVILSLLLLGSLFYSFKLKSETSQMVSKVVAATTEKDKILFDLNSLKANYDKAIAEKTSMSNELITERDKVINLIADLKKSKGSTVYLDKYKSKYLELESKMNNLLAENDSLKQQNGVLTTQRDSIQLVTTEAKKVNENLAVQNEGLSKTVEKASKLAVLNLKSVAYKERSSGKQIDTEKAKRADVLKISFTIAENQVAIPGEKTYNVQVIDAENNVLGDKKVENYGEKTLMYSFTKTINYENKTVDVTQDLPVSNITGGTYFVNVFEKGELVSSTSFALR